MWEKLSAGGQESQCGWLKDKFGLSWQIIPSALGELLGDPDPQKSKRVMQAMQDRHRETAGCVTKTKQDHRVSPRLPCVRPQARPLLLPP